MKNFSHISVLLQETIYGLNIKKGGLYVDGTLGGAGHSMQIIKQGGRIIGIDRDDAALDAAREKIEGIFVKDNFNNIKNIIKKLDIDYIDGAILDLGVSSYQLDTPERGFSYRYDSPLDMRMNLSDKLTAESVINTYSQGELERILFQYGEERYAKQIVRKIIDNRQQKPIKTTFELVDIIKSAVPAKVRALKHPAKKTFQAIRIEVNDELSGLSSALENFCDVLSTDGRLAVITFHSLEDRIVKTTFLKLAKGCTCPPDFPICICSKKQTADIITKKPIIPTKQELEINPRSASSKLRILRKR